MTLENMKPVSSKQMWAKCLTTFVQSLPATRLPCLEVLTFAYLPLF